MEEESVSLKALLCMWHPGLVTAVLPLPHFAWVIRPYARGTEIPDPREIHELEGWTFHGGSSLPIALPEFWKTEVSRAAGCMLESS